MCPYLPKQLFIPLQAGWGSPAPRRGPKSRTFKKAPSFTNQDVVSRYRISYKVEVITLFTFSKRPLLRLFIWKPWLLCGSGEKKKKKSPPNWNLPLAGMCIGADGGKNNSFEHNMHQCVQICFMAEVGFFLIVNMSCSFVPPTQKCVLLGIRFYSWPS